ncbi:MAG: hypothetical protein EOO09_03745 [Chitinophagaceae bacterium]|nr:MAG: hypothetical protein EOO09_03745 [Chitinophagaceae bacterium]
MRFSLLILLALATVLRTGAQTPVADSLLRKAEALKKDSNRVNYLLAAAKLVAPADQLRARKIFNQSLAESIEIGYYPGHFNSLVELADLFHTTNQLDSALLLHEQSLRVAEGQGDSLNIGMALFNISIGYRGLSSFEKALDYSLRGRRILEKYGKKEILVQVNDALCNLYQLRGEKTRAIEFGNLAVKQARELKQDYFLTSALVSLATVYLTSDDQAAGKPLLQEALTLAKKLENPRVMAAVLSNLAEIERMNHNFSAMSVYIMQSLGLARQTGAKDMECSALRALAIAALQGKDYSRAKQLATEARQISMEYDLKLEQISCTRLLSSIAYATQQPALGYELDDLSNTILDSALTDLMSKQSAELDKKYETEKKVSTIQRLEAEQKVQALTIRQKNLVNSIFIGAAIILALVALLIYRNYRQKQKLQQQRIRELETENQLASAEAILQGEERERTRLSKDLHDGLGGMLSGIRHTLAGVGQSQSVPDAAMGTITRSIGMLDSSITEMRRLAHNLMPDALIRFGLDTALRDFCHDINKSGALAVSYQSVGLAGLEIAGNTSVTIYRIVQELVNNIMKHAAAKTALVQVTKIPGQMTITVEDDGKGFDTGSAASGIGLENIRSRVSYLRGKLDIESTPGSGTSVYIIVEDAG